jgi:homoserine O-acetyltransferase
VKDEIFDSSDTQRSARPLAHAELREVGPIELALGGTLPAVTVAYETFGTLNQARDNAILVCHAMSGDSHVARHSQTDDPGWWDVVVGPGKVIDTDRFFVVCPNLLGGCRGTTGPGSANPATGKPYGRDFPTITLKDMVEVQRRLMDLLGIPQWLAVAGGSLGGHQAITWATEFPEKLRGVIALATSPRLTSQALAFDVVGRNAILRDPHFHNGQYYDKPKGPGVGLAIARMIGHITYLSREAMTEKFDTTRAQPRDVAIEFEKKFSVGSYLGYQGTRFVERFDANSYMALTLAMDFFDCGNTPEKLAATLAKARCRWLVLSFSSDWLFPPDQSRDIVNALLANKAAVSYCNVESNCGHDAFLLENDLHMYGEMMRAFLDHLVRQSGSGAAPAEEKHGPTSIFHQKRVDYDRIVELVPPQASVLDLGCGSGSLLARLQQRDACRLVGVDVSQEKILAALERGLDVIHADLNAGLKAFADQEFDMVVLSQTLQAVAKVEEVINDMLRVGKRCIVSFPNFAHAPLRRMLAEDGRAPRGSNQLQESWYTTRNIRFLTIADFEDFCAEKGIRVERRIALDLGADREIIDNPNLNADLAIFVISRNGVTSAP